MTATQVFFTRLWMPPVLVFANLHSWRSGACAFSGAHSQVSPLPLECVAPRPAALMAAARA